MDRLHYNYITGTNKLDHITDDVTDDARYATDLDGQTAGNYDYDAIGNLIKDTKGIIGSLQWNVYGKIKRIERTDGVNIDYTYDVLGNRISKTLDGPGVTGGPIATWYVKDAGGNTLTTYTVKASTITADEQYVYGTSRLGAKNRNLTLNSSLSIASSTVSGIGTVYNDEMIRGKTQYELGNHLGNVLATITDKKIPHITGGVVDYYEAEVLSAQDYYPFGMMQPGRTYNTGSYRFGFNGQEKDVDNGAELYTALFWEYDSRIGRRWNLDPKPLTGISDYACFFNNPIFQTDILGDRPIPLYDKFKTWGWRIDSWFGPRNTGIAGASTYHKGLDFNFAGGGDTDFGAPILATHDGTAKIDNNPDGKDGRNVKITSPDGKFRTVYMHLSKITIKEGEVSESDEIGEMGGSANGAEGLPKGRQVHLHYTIQRFNEKTKAWDAECPE